jgi:glycine oxidase
MTDQKTKSGTNADIVIVGAGVIGLSIARALARRGVRKVMIIERGLPGAEASWAAGGILAPQVEADHSDDFFRLACASRDLYPGFARALKEESGVEVELETTGTLCVVFNDQDEEELQRRYEWQKSEGLQVEWLSSDRARELEPQLSSAITCALRLPNDYQVENRLLVKALIRANEKLGVSVITNCEVSSIQVASGTIRGVETSAGFVSAPITILAAGAWSSLLSPSPAIKIEPVRGQMLCFDAQPQLVRHVVYSSRGYLVPRMDGRLLAGSTAEHVGYDRSVTAEASIAIKSMALEIAPALKDLSLRDSWAGFRPRAKDDLPVLGPTDDVEGLVFATGHYRNGILLAPITGDLIADAVVGDVLPPLLKAFSPNRFRSSRDSP